MGKGLKNMERDFEFGFTLLAIQTLDLRVMNPALDDPQVLIPHPELVSGSQNFMNIF